MARSEIPIEGTRTLELTVEGDVVVEGGAGPSLWIDDESDEDPGRSIQRTDDVISLVVHDDCRLVVPPDLTVRLVRVDGDLRVSELRGALAVGKVNGDASFQRIDGTISCDTINGDARVQATRSTVSIIEVSGDTKLVECRGEVRIDQVQGDLSANDLTGGLRVLQVGGDVRLRTSFAGGTVYDVDCRGSTRIIIAGSVEQTSARFELRSLSGRIVTDVTLADVERSADVLRGRLGEGSAEVRIKSDGPITLTGREEGFDWGSMGDFFRSFGQDFSELFSTFTVGNNAEFEQRLREQAEKLRSKAEKFSQRAEKAAKRVSERAQRHAERMARQAERQAARWEAGSPGGWRHPQPPPAPPARPETVRRASREERMLVLQMLADGKISAEEAARLLEALGG
ncbi:MAG TPA: hypothetical protein VKX96_09265 [Chloroflexota bacterium]|nr:hypothetical protein [Chloroflexota bacterium]